MIFTVYLKTPTSFNEDYFKGIGSHRKKAGIDQIKQQVIARRAIEQWILLSALHAASQLQAHAVLNLILLQFWLLTPLFPVLDILDTSSVKQMYIITSSW